MPNRGNGFLAAGNATIVRHYVWRRREWAPTYIVARARLALRFGANR